MNVRRFFRRRREDEELVRELAAHLEHEIAEQLERGLTPAEAGRRARLKLGSTVSVREEVWEWNTMEMLGNGWRDLKYAMRTLGRAPGFAMAGILLMALGIGANTALFTVVRSVLLKPLPFENADRLAMVYEVSSDGKNAFNPVAGGSFVRWQKEAKSFEQMALVRDNAFNLSGTGGQLPEQLRATLCSWNLFAALGAQPALGRSFDKNDDRPQANATVILSWGLWKRRFGGDRGIVGSNIQLDAVPYTVVGVMPEWFAYPSSTTQVWVPVGHELSPMDIEVLDSHSFTVVGLLKSGTSAAQGQKEIDTNQKRIHEEFPNLTIGRGANVRLLLDDMVGDYRTPLYVLLGATGCVLIIACLNVASLFVARAAARRREMAIRRALGGSRWRLVREQVMESILLALAGGGIGLALAHGAVRWVVNARQDMARAEAIQMDGAVWLFAIGITLAGGIFAGVVSAVSVRNSKLRETLQESSRSHGGGQSKARLRKALLTAELGLTVVLLLAAGLLLKSYEKLRNSDMGVTTKNVLTMTVFLPDARYGRAEQKAAFYERLIGAVRALPGVRQAGLVTVLPGQGWGGDNLFTIAEHPPFPKGEFHFAIRRGADPGYFEAMHIPFLKGRTFRPGERLGAAKFVIINETFARRYFQGEDPIGKHVRVGLEMSPVNYEIIGVVGDTKYSISKEAEATAYYPLSLGIFEAASIAVLPEQDAASVAVPIEKLIADMDGDLGISNVLTMEELIGQSTTSANFNATLILGFAVAALILASVGLYGVLSYMVSQRTSEIGVRMALGAQRGEVLRLTLMDGLRPASLGLVLGLAGGAAAAKTIQGLLYGVQPLDASVFAGVAMILLGVAVAASVLPAWRAARLNPVDALRVE